MTRKTDRLWLKTLAFILCVLSITVMAAGIGATALVAVEGGADQEDYWKNCFSSMVYSDLEDVVGVYAQERLGTAALEEYNRFRFGESIFSGDEGLSPYTKVYLGQSNLRYEIYDEKGNRVARTYQGGDALATFSWRIDDPIVLKETQGSEEDFRKLDHALEYDGNWGESGVGRILYWERGDKSYTITGYLLAGFPYENDRYGALGEILGAAYTHRGLALAGAILGLIAVILCVVYLISAAGRRCEEPGIHLNFLDKLPLDLYAGALGLGLVGVFYLLFMLADRFFEWYRYDGSMPSAELFLLAAAGLIALGGTLILAILLTLVTRIRYGGGYWWRHSAIGWCLRKLWHFARFLGRGLRAVLRAMPTIWLWLLGAGALWLLLFLCAFGWRDGASYLLFSLAAAAAALYWAMSVSKLRRNAKNLAEGRLDGVDSSHLYGVFREISENMRDLGKGAERAVEEKMKSERLKTELITNVSHDIKTPLTSIVNYVDLLRKPHTPEEEAEYLKVLDRQSKRMKKLTEDLVELSKASTGNIPAYLEPTNLVEMANQALAEYEEKFGRANLQPVLTVTGRNGKQLPEDSRVMVLADGRLLWRVLDNLFGNVFKYALPGTRVYVDIARYEKTTMLSVKNVSRERLNVSAEELMERFVRGDTSRNTEGSGLGLNIAKSLMDLQKAELNLVVDGDLFKAILLYDALPEREEPEE